MASVDSSTGEIIAAVSGTPLIRFDPPPTSAAPNIDLPLQLEAPSATPTSVTLASNAIADADSARLSVELSADSGRFELTTAGQEALTEINQKATAAALVSVRASSGNSPAVEGVNNVMDGNTRTKYLNFDGVGSGLVFELTSAEVVGQLSLTTRTNDDIWAWDPKTIAVYGANDDLTWGSSQWTLVQDGLATNLANTRGATSVVDFDNATPYRFYKMVVTEIKGVHKNTQRYACLLYTSDAADE